MAVFSKRKLFARAVLGKPPSSEKIFRRNQWPHQESLVTSTSCNTLFTTESIQISVKKEGEEMPLRDMEIAYYIYKCRKVPVN